MQREPDGDAVEDRRGAPTFSAVNGRTSVPGASIKPEVDQIHS